MIVEVSQFRLADGVGEEEFIRATSETQTGFLERQPGFRSRELLRSSDGTWMGVVRFDDQESASAAFAAFADHPSAREFERMLDFTSVGMSHWTQVQDWLWENS